ncbi:MAG: primary-amine oxidase [Chthoniobacterales bacterium]
MNPLETPVKSSSKNAIHHPLEPLSGSEIQATVDILRKEKDIGKTTRFVSVVLKEPSKKDVKKFSPNSKMRREAFVVLFDNSKNKCYEAVVAITEGSVKSWKHIPGVQPTMTADEQIECEQAVLSSQEFRDACKRHGVNDINLVMVDIWTAGNYGAKEESNTRLARPLCFVRADATDNGYARPIEGLRPVVDLNQMKVLRVEDFGPTPLPTKAGNYRADRVKNLRKDIKPLEIIQPEGPSFQVNGNEVNWQKWNFIIGFNSREGLTLHNITYNDEGKDRSILYRASLSEMVVPYGDPRPTQNKKNAFDSGEYGMGQCANSLELGCDCLGHIKYFDATMTTSRGELQVIKNAICMHEEDYGTLWKHTDRRDNHVEVRRSRRLVVSSVSTVENYEYGFFWYFYQDGNIQFELKLTGILSLGTLPAGEKSKYGNLVAPQLYAPNHQHFFNMRLDFDIDGEKNSVLEVNVESEKLGKKNPYENAFYAQPTLLKTEQKARRSLNLEKGRYWRIVNENVKNELGEPVGYKLLPGDNCVPYASKNASWRKRAGFTNHHVWVTPFDEDEKFGAGNYPNQNKGGDGLIKWTKKNRNVENTDVVFWYTMGHTHIPRPEDYPVMPTAYIGFLLKPHGFFAMNPANDVPPTKSTKSSDKSGSCCS